MKSGVIIVEGNIGAGKSTFAQYLARALDGEYLPEPADGTNPYLEDYYRNPARWAFEMQMFLLTRRYRAQKYAQSKVRHNGGFVVLDRSYYGDVCFANVQRQLGYFSERDYETYLSHHADMKVNLEPPAAAIFLCVTPEVCKARINRRMRESEGRECESGITIDYLKRLDREIRCLADYMTSSTIIYKEPWNCDITDDDIEKHCKNRALEIMDLSMTVYDFWTGTDGIGR